MSATLGRATKAAARGLPARAPLPAGRPLEPATRATMEERLGHDFARVRVHDDPAAAREAGACAYAVGSDVVLGADADALSLAHELAHVAQQERPGADADAEPRAAAAAARVTAGERVEPAALGAAAPGLHAQDGDDKPAEEAPKEDKPADPAFSIDWELFKTLAAIETDLKLPPLGAYKPFQAGFQSNLIPPPPLPSGPTSFTPFQYTLPPSYTPPFPTGAPTGGLPGTPAPAAAGTTPTASSDPPSRASVYDTGQFSLGLRLGLPEGAKPKPGEPPSAAADAVKQADFQFQMLTGKVPSGWEAVDKGKLAGAIWGIFSTNIAPDLARKITSGLSGSTKSGISYQLDATLLTSFNGGGLTFSIITP